MNVNQYIYSYYQYFTNAYVDDLCIYLYIEVNDNLSSIEDVITRSKIQIACLNDSDKVKNYKKTRAELLKIFESKFPNKSAHEI